MKKNNVSEVWLYLQNKLVYHPPDVPKPFVLGETPQDDRRNPPDLHNGLQNAARQLEALLRQAGNLTALMEKAIIWLHHERNAEKTKILGQEVQNLAKRQEELAPLLLAYRSGEQEVRNQPVSFLLDENIKILHDLYNLPTNKDLIIRNITLPVDPPVKGALVFVDGLVDKKIINLSIMLPLMLLKDGCGQGDDLLTGLITECLPSNQAKTVADFAAVADSLNLGDTALFLDGVDEAVVMETKGYEHRSIDRPQIEQTVRGAQAAFSETMRVNTGLIRIALPTSDLVTEMLTVGKRAPRLCAVIYLKSIANQRLVAEIKRRINGIITDYVPDLGALEQLIEDRGSRIFPQQLSTERPDRVAAHLMEGRVAILLDGLPFANILPVGLYSFFHSSEDSALKLASANFMRLLRVFGMLLGLFLPALYLALSYFHQEALPAELALAIAGARERVPFPIMFEILLMEISWELIREAGLRIPGLLGATIGIVGALILGQAAVSANIVSPVTVIVVALTGLASFTIPDYKLSFALRLHRFFFIVLAAAFGLVGMAFGIAVLLAQLTSMKSMGVPYLAPTAPRTQIGPDRMIRGPAYEQENRPDELNPGDGSRQPRVSRSWREHPARGEGE